MLNRIFIAISCSNSACWSVHADYLLKSQISPLHEQRRDLITDSFFSWVKDKGHNIEVKYTISKTAKRSGELYTKSLLKNKRSLKRILPDFVIGAHAEQYGDAFVT